ncbi:acetyl-CoA carboxylase carboxyltransferase subunit alpha/beta [Aldersonia sp. NBC_00410]|uniref:carboxyl transferase domain-containing protein n=1 Tax=Aldersonia sp. NBC_00410 TaxID=2975954 RepID=UPI00224CAFEF|nr:carboxyl transferase domain-containing protein [Aldersonia sp. NBC_00410]MCX5045666.1 acetyl-CoA carboxylase carboxyltransferase subunit alpha/beta [Aldersonia sp. NBC_00410]
MTASAQRVSARDLLASLLDPGSFVGWDAPPIDLDPDDDYRADLDRAAARAGTDEAVLTGEGLLRGRRVAVLACEFGFLGGSIGVAAAERIVTAIERATTEGLPLVATPTSGGTRMQEGTVAFVQMVKIAAAVAAHKAARLPYLVYLRNPTMGGVFASWGSLGHLTFAEPGALIGFLGPRVYEALYGQPFPENVQTAENLYHNGVIDGVLALAQFRLLAHRALVVMTGETAQRPIADPAAGAVPTDDPAWDAVLASRRPDRPGIRAILRHATERVPLSGTGQGEADRTVLHALARLRGRPCVLFGHDRDTHAADPAMGPAALREARRSMKLAEELGLPLVLVIDTAGASLSPEAEESGLAPEIARCIADLVTLDTPTVAVLLGQGTGGGALALLPADRVIAAQHAWLAPLPPEGASAIVYRDTDHAPMLAAKQRIRAMDLLADGVVDGVVPEYPDAAAEPVDFALRVVAAIAAEIDGLAEMTAAQRIQRRSQRYRRLGLPR